MQKVSSLALAIALLAAACGGSSDPSAIETTSTAAAPTTTAAATTTDAPAATAAPTTAPTSTTTEPSPEWVEHIPGEPCQCADGSEFRFWTRTASTTKVVLYFEGGGACFSAATCSFTNGSYQVTAPHDRSPANAGGIFDFDNDANPFADWSFVYVPYCTGNVHIGTSTHEYSPDLVVNHNGFVNASHGLNYLIENFPDAEEVVVAGSSAGGVPAPLFGGLVSDALPDAAISVLSDASGAYPDVPLVNATIGALWGTFEAVPDWPETADLEPSDWSIPGLFVYAGLHDPKIRMARFDNAFDSTQAEFTVLAGLSSDQIMNLIDANAAAIEARGVPVHTYVAPGTDHTILGGESLYNLTVDNVAFIDWLTDYVNGVDVADVHCVDCGP